MVPTQECHCINPNSIVHHSIGFIRQLVTQTQSYKIIWVTQSKLYEGSMDTYKCKDTNTYVHVSTYIHTHTYMPVSVSCSKFRHMSSQHFVLFCKQY